MKHDSRTAIEWLKRNPSAILRLFCFSCAGGTVSVFRSWAKRLPRTVELCGVELPGRGSRWREPLVTDVPTLVDLICSELQFRLEKPFIFFGHSMGNFLCFEVARQLRRSGLAQPLHLFVSSGRAPQIPQRTEPISSLPENEFIQRLRGFNGTPPEILENPEIMQIFAPIIRADFTLCESYKYDDDLPLDCPISSFGGWGDPEATPEELAAWSEQTRHSFSLQMFHGSHFFLRTVEDEFLDAFSEKLLFIADAIYQSCFSELPYKCVPAAFGPYKQ